MTKIDVPNGYSLVDTVCSWIFPDIGPVPEKTWIDEEGGFWFARCISISGAQSPVLVSQSSPGSPLNVLYPEYVTGREVESKISWLLGLDIETSSALEIIKGERELSTIVESLRGLKPYMTDTVFEAIIKSIIQQQVSYRAANIFTKRLVCGTKEPIIFMGQETYQFPTADEIIETGPEALRSFGLGYKVDYVMGVSELVINGDLRPESLLDSDYQSIANALLPIRGIGEWTAQVVAIAAIGDFAVFPYSDLGVQNMLGRLYNDGTRMKKRDVKELASSWGDAGPLAMYLLMGAEVLGLVP